MGIPSPHTTPLELRMNARGKLMLYFDGRRIPGIMEINVNQENGARSFLTVQIIGLAVRFETDEREPIPEGVYWSPWYPGFYLEINSSPMGNAFEREWISRKDEFPNG